MILGQYPCCDGDLCISIEGINGLPKFSKENCPHCGAVVWHYLSRLEPESYTEEGFNEKFEVNETTKKIKLK